MEGTANNRSRHSCAGERGGDRAKAEQARKGQAIYRQRQKARMNHMEDQVTVLTQRLESQVAKSVRFKAQRDTLRESLSTMEPSSQVEAVAMVSPEMVLEVVRLLRGPTSTLTLEDCGHVSEKLMARLCLESVQRLKILLETGGQVAGSPQEQELRDVLTKVTTLTMHVWNTNFTLMSKAAAAFLRLSGGVSPPDPGHSELVLTALNLGEDQKSRILLERADVASKLAGIDAKCAHLFSGLPGNMRSPGGGTTTGRLQIMQVLHFVEAMPLDELESSVKAEVQAEQDFVKTCCLGLLTPQQAARGHVAAFPYMLDVGALADILMLARTGSASSADDDSVTMEMLKWLSDGMEPAEPPKSA